MGKIEGLKIKIGAINALSVLNKILSSYYKIDYENETIQQLIDSYNNTELGFVDRIEAYCWFHNTGTIAGRDNKPDKYFRYKWDSGRTAHYYRCHISELTREALTIDKDKITKYYNNLLKYSKGYKNKNIDLYTNIKMRLEEFLSSSESLSEPKTNKKDSYLNYNSLQKAVEAINNLYNEINKFSKKGLETKLYSKASDVKFRINTDIEMVMDTSYGYDLSDTERTELAKAAVNASMAQTSDWAEFIIPSISQMISHIESKFNNIKFNEKKLLYGADRLFKEKGIINTLDEKTKSLRAELKKLKKKLNDIYDSYNELEKSAQNNFEGKKSKKDYSKAEIAKKYGALVSAAGAKNAKKYLKKILKNTKSKVSEAQVLSIYKKYKKAGKTKGALNIENDPEKPKNPPGNQKTRKPKGKNDNNETGATVVKTKKKKTKSKEKGKTSNKNEKKKSKNLAVVSAATMASYEKTMQKKTETIDKIKVGTTNKIEQAKLNLTTKISQINSDRDADIANIEAERDSKIAELYEQASNEINGIDPTDSNAKEQIDAIKTDLENNINTVNEEANEQIEAVKADAEAQIVEANEASASEIENIQKESDGEIDNITKNGLQEETTAGQDLETAADMPPTAKEVDETKINDANSNKEASSNSLEESRTAYNNDVSAKEQEINNTSNTQSEIEQQPITEESSSSEETMVYQQESNNSSPSESSNYSNYSSNNYNNSGNESSGSGSGLESGSGDVYAEEIESEVVETPAVPEEELGSETTIIPDNPNNEELTEIESEVGSGSTSEIIATPKKENKSNVAIPIGLGVAAAGAAAVAGVRFVKNRKQNDNSEEMYDDENNGIADYESGSDDSDYMKDDYLGPSGSMYTDTDYEDDELSEIPDNTKYNDAAHLEEQIEDDNDAFTEDEILNDLG